MTDFSLALAYDVAGKYEQAVAAYEQAILLHQAPVEAFANLSFIYWQSGTQQPATSGAAVPVVPSEMPWQACFRVLQAGLHRYPKDLELSFWARYYPYRGIFDDFSAADCQQLLLDCTNHNRTIIPCFFLSLFEEESYCAEIARILTDCQNSPTAKNKWITSVLSYRPYHQG